ncbi:MAG: hypothetical protein JW881_13855 [Spirochaetales bacterium]|nr:hypothetical protein [Spirochaetales bacterium]
MNERRGNRESLLEEKSYQNQKALIRVEGTTISFSGNIDIIDIVNEMSPILGRIHDEIIRKNIKHIRIDITALDYINSSGISLFIKWARDDMRLPDNLKYTIEFVCNKANVWHTSSFSMLHNLSKDLFIITKQESV